MEPIHTQTLSTLLTVLGLVLGVITMQIGVVKYIMEKLGAVEDRSTARLDKVQLKLEELDKLFDVRLSAMAEKEAKARHDLANATQQTLAATAVKLDGYAKREEIRETEQRLTIQISGVGTKVDKLSDSIATINTMQTSMQSLVAQLDRMAMRIDNFTNGRRNSSGSVIGGGE
jgi:hypothetical protein